jgi:cytochrome c
MKSFLFRVFSIVALTALLTPAFADEAPPPTQQAKAVETLVIKAAALIEKEGKTAAFSEFKKRDSEWLHGDTYLYTYDSKGNVLLNAAFPQREGTNISLS